MSTRIKICGITSVKDALLAVESGAHYIGLIFVAETPRALEVNKAREIVQAIRGIAQCVGVFRDNPLTEINDIVSRVGLDLVQLHGAEAPSFCQQVTVPVIKTIIYAEDIDEERVTPYLGPEQANIRFLLLERARKFQALPWDQEALQNVEKVAALLPSFMAGGLTPENVGDMVYAFKPYAVDVASGIESEPGIKDPERLKAFCQSVTIQNQHRGASSCNH